VPLFDSFLELFLIPLSPFQVQSCLTLLQVTRLPLIRIEQRYLIFPTF
jgi:hypothetical protein